MKQNLSPNKRNSNGFFPLAQETASLLDPVLRKKFGLTVELLENWTEIVGAGLAEDCQPWKIIWPRRREADKGLKPAMLVIASEGFACLKIQHESDEIIQRLNVFFGFCAIGKIKIEQRQIIRSAPPVLPPPALREEERNWLTSQTSAIENETLRNSLWHLGQAIVSSK